MVIGPIAVLVGSTAAAARPSALAFVWDAPDGCPTTEAVLSKVEQSLARPGQANTPMAVAARVLPRPSEPWRVTVSLDVGGTRTERQFEAETCDAAASALAVIMTLALEEKVEASPPTPKPPAPPEPARAETRDPLAGEATVSPALTWGRSWSAMATGLIDWDTTPQPPAYGFELAGRHLWSGGRWRLGAIAGVSLFPRHRLEQELPSEGDADFWLLGVSGLGCVGVAFSGFELGPCLGAELSAMHVFDSRSNFGYHNSTQYWLSLATSAVLSWNFDGKWSLVLRIEALVPKTQPRFYQEGGNYVLYEIPAIAWRGALGFERRFE